MSFCLFGTSVCQKTTKKIVQTSPRTMIFQQLQFSEAISFIKLTMKTKFNQLNMFKFNNQKYKILTLFGMRGWGKNFPTHPTSFPLELQQSQELASQNFLTFSFSLLDTLL